MEQKRGATRSYFSPNRNQHDFYFVDEAKSALEFQIENDACGRGKDLNRMLMYYSSLDTNTNQLLATQFRPHEYFPMAETRKTANKGHYLRNQKCDTLKIVRDQNVYMTQNIEEK